MIKKAILSLFLGGIAVFAFSPFDFWPLIFVSYVGLLLLIIHQSPKKAMFIGFSWGFGYFAAGVHWVNVSIQEYGGLPFIITVPLVALLVAYLALYPALFAFFLQKLTQKNNLQTNLLVKLTLLAPALWQLVEFLRGYILTGFSWLQIGYTQVDGPLASLIPIIGIYGINLLIPVICGFIAYVCLNKQNLPKKALVLLAFLGLISFITLVVNQIQWVEKDTIRSANIALVQGNIEQSLKWNPRTLNSTLETYKKLTEQHVNSSDIIIWPEAAISDLEINQQFYLKNIDELATKNDVAIAVGLIDFRAYNNELNIFNALVVLGDEKPYQYPTDNRYNKHHLVPFGEFTPLEMLFKPIAKLLNIPMSAMTQGEAIQKPIKMKGFNFTTVICYEVILPNLVWQNFSNQTDFLLTVSNDAWFGDSIGPWQHLQMARARAIEFGRPLLRSTNNGITVAIDHLGNILDTIPQFQENVLTIKISPTKGMTPYANWGDYPFWGLVLIMLVSSFSLRKRFI